MSSHRTTWMRLASGVAGAAVVALFAACADGTSTGPSTSIRQLVVTPPPRITKVCKVGPAGTYNFEAVSVEGLGTFLTGTPFTPTDGATGVAFTLAAGECKDVYSAGTVLESVKFREVTPLPTNVYLEKITWQTLAFLGFPDGVINTVTGTNEIRLEPFGKPHVVTFYNKSDYTPPTGLGCTPGFWKNSTGSWVGYAPGQDFDAVFGVNLFNPNITLLQAASLGGGGKNAMARHAVAALLSAAHPGVEYPITGAAVIAGVQAAAASGDYETLKNSLAAWNELNCPLSNDNSF
jgi:hypothetical protein